MSLITRCCDVRPNNGIREKTDMSRATVLNNSNLETFLSKLMWIWQLFMSCVSHQTVCRCIECFHHPHYPSCLLAYSEVTKLLHPCLSLASLWMVPQLWFMFISASIVLHQVVFDWPCFCFPSDCNFGDSILAQNTPRPVPSLPGDDGLRILLLALC